MEQLHLKKLSFGPGEEAQGQSAFLVCVGPQVSTHEARGLPL